MKKQFLFGFDGFDNSYFQYLPRLKAYLNSSGFTDWNITEPYNGMWERGWSKILTGKSAIHNEAYYNRLTYKYLRSASLGSKSLKNESATLWNRDGIGLYGFPGTYPIPAGNYKFLIAGAGAGKAPTTTIPKDAVNDNDIFDIIRKENPIWEVRHQLFSNLTINEYIETCYKYLKGNVESFKKIINYTNVNEAVFISRWPDCLMGPLANQQLFNNEIKEKLKVHFEKCENILLSLINKYDADICICSDHGAAIRKGSINLNALFSNIPIKSKFYHHNYIKKTFAPHLSKLLKKVNYIGSSQRVHIPTDGIFAIRYIPGLFTLKNSNYDKDALRHKIEYKLRDEFSKIGENPLNVSVSINNKIDLNNSILPDLLVTIPEGYFFENKIGDKLIDRFKPESLSISSKMNILSDTCGSIKASNPLVYSNLKKSSNFNDLTSIRCSFFV